MSVMATTDLAGGHNNLGPESPAASGKHPIGRRKSGMRLELLEPEDDDDMLEEGATASRRPSTCSLSRFRSCPQLAAAAQSQVSPSIDVVDTDDVYDVGELSSPPTGDTFYITDRGQCSPTPPSTPGSRRSHLSLKEGSNSNRISGMSPSSTPKLSRRSKPRDYKLLGRTSSGESGPADHMSFSSIGVQFSMRDENSIRFDEFNDRLSTKPDSGNPGVNFDDNISDHVEDDKRGHRDYHHQGVSDDSRDKCQRWLQSLKITRADRIKSRSHIQLPPI